MEAAGRQRAYVLRWISVLHSKTSFRTLGLNSFATPSPLRLAAFSESATALRLRGDNVKSEIIAVMVHFDFNQSPM